MGWAFFGEREKIAVRLSHRCVFYTTSLFTKNGKSNIIKIITLIGNKRINRRKLNEYKRNCAIS